MADLKPGDYILDASCGMGGLARHLAKKFSGKVVGVNLTPSFVQVAETLSASTGLDKSVESTRRLASLDFQNATFDIVWTQHVVMNISNRDQVYKEFRRVLKSSRNSRFMM